MFPRIGGFERLRLDLIGELRGRLPAECVVEWVEFKGGTGVGLLDGDWCLGTEVTVTRVPVVFPDDDGVGDGAVEISDFEVFEEREMPGKRFAFETGNVGFMCAAYTPFENLTVSSLALWKSVFGDVVPPTNDQLHQKL